MWFVFFFGVYDLGLCVSSRLSAGQREGLPVSTRFLCCTWSFSRHDFTGLLFPGLSFFRRRFMLCVRSLTYAWRGGVCLCVGHLRCPRPPGGEMRFLPAMRGLVATLACTTEDLFCNLDTGASCDSLRGLHSLHTSVLLEYFPTWICPAKI